MTLFRILLAGLWLILLGYTGVTIANHGLDLAPIFFGDIARLAWPGQFNLDFMCFLTLSALWTAWRNRFSGLGLLLAVIAFVGGAAFLLPYLLILSVQTKGDIRAVLLGKAFA
jgi:hypothetical protein